MYKFRVLPVLEGRAAEYFYELQERMANADPGFDVKKTGDAFKNVLERSRKRKSERDGLLK